MKLVASRKYIWYVGDNSKDNWNKSNLQRTHLQRFSLTSDTPHQSKKTVKENVDWLLPSWLCLFRLSRQTFWLSQPTVMGTAVVNVVSWNFIQWRHTRQDEFSIVRKYIYNINHIGSHNDHHWDVWHISVHSLILIFYVASTQNVIITCQLYTLSSILWVYYGDF